MIPAVALSMLTLVPGGMGGSETYARELTRQLATTQDVTATAFVPTNAAGFSRGIPERVVNIGTGLSTVNRLATVARLSLRAGALRREMSAAHVVHYPFTVALPKPAKGQGLVQTLLDVQHLDLPQLFSRAELAYRKLFYEGAAARADVVITISEFARGRMIDLLGLSPERVRVAPLGVDTTEFEPHAGEREPFVLYPARGWPHKNHDRLIAAMRIVRATRPDLRLVLTGGDLERLGELPDWVDRLGLVSADKLKELYRTASVMAFPSLYEGFGLPPLEAMASGCPVAASNAGSIPEVCGSAAVLFDPRDDESIAAGILEAIARAPELFAAGLEQAGRFTWERCRDIHIGAYKDAS